MNKKKIKNNSSKDKSSLTINGNTNVIDDTPIPTKEKKSIKKNMAEKSITENAYLASKSRYEVLDGLRGVASFIVIIFHLFESYTNPLEPYKEKIYHGYLAVDFFFALSGFVIGYAYDDRWGTKMNIIDFIKRRITRLHPMVILGHVVGLFLFHFGSYDFFPLIMTTPWWKLFLLFIYGCFLLPSPKQWDIRGWEEIYPLNGACWSLMWEYIANILYALIIRHFNKITTMIFVGFSSLLTINLCMNIDIFGVLDGRGSKTYSVAGGWSFDKQHMLIAITRLLYPFFCGLLISRLNWKINVKKGGFWLCSLIISICFCLPHIGGDEHSWMNGLYECICILIIIPIVVMLGAGSQVDNNISKKLCNFLGDVSYPLYITHYPVIYMQMAWISKNPDANELSKILTSVSIFIFSIFLAYIYLKNYDEPVREWIKNHWFQKKAKNN
ncbi:acyltransferase [Piromyces finnis]|uniref:Acyltransferase n=1 Tax=Piromyces finnis TaxID=1754191 RepID=A0A1Y1V4R6_9FUNG|nr:acyltransferase [Piromyces finnis]|eukprot:ORX47121.1 acyltransferase [Piromyces finnis]